MINLNEIFTNIENIYYGHGIGNQNELKIINSIFSIGLRCSHDEFYYTSVQLTNGKNIDKIDDKIIKQLNSWPHKESKKIVIISLPIKYHIIDNPTLKTYGKRHSAYYYKINNTNYIRREFIKGYYDADLKTFIENPTYYENLSKKEQEILFYKVREEYINTIEDSIGIPSYIEATSLLNKIVFPQDILEQYNNQKTKESSKR